MRIRSYSNDGAVRMGGLTANLKDHAYEREEIR